MQLEFPILKGINSGSLSAIFVVQSALAMIFLAKGDFAFVSGCSTAVAVVSRVLCCYVHIPQLLTVKPVLVNRVVFRIARASPTRLLMAVKDKYTRIKCSCQIKKKKQCSSKLTLPSLFNWQRILSILSQRIYRSWKCIGVWFYILIHKCYVSLNLLLGTFW